jgi:calcineurin-like phosphoesterase family protein
MSDMHFGHTNLLKYEPRRLAMFGITPDPDDPAKTTALADEALMTHLNQIIRPHDTVIVLGDVVMGKRDLTVPFTKNLHGYKVLAAPGNHDMGFWPNSIKNPEKRDSAVRMWVDAGWDVKFDTLSPKSPYWYRVADLVTYGHLPLRGTPDHGEAEDVRYAHHMRNFADLPIPHIHGHSHGHNGRIHDNGRQFDVGIDGNNLGPTHSDEIWDFIQTFHKNNK